MNASADKIAIVTDVGTVTGCSLWAKSLAYPPIVFGA